jgi:hypothetical protein
MKKLILAAMVSAFAIAAQAGETPSCCPKAKATEQTKATCPAGKQTKASCPSTAKASKATVTKTVKSPKAVADAAR